MRTRLARIAPPLIGLVLFLVALEVLAVELHTVGWHEITNDVAGMPTWRLAAAFILTVFNYLVLAGYDLVACRYAGVTMARARIAATALLAYAVSNSVGFAMLSGASIRYRFYSRWGVTAGQLSRIVFSYSVTFWLGLCALGGLSLVVSPLAGAEGPGRVVTSAIGVALMLGVAAYLLAPFVRTAPLRLGRFTWPQPPPAVALLQFLVSAVDWMLAGAVLYVLLPPSTLTFLTFLGAFLVAILAGMVSHVPGGAGVFEGLIVVLLRPWLTAGAIIPALVVYRVIYYLLPFVLGLAALVVDEARQRRAQLARAGTWLGRMSDGLTPRLLGALTFFSGAVLLLSGATPASPGRLDLVSRLLPVGVVEGSHFAGSVAGVGLLVLSHGVGRRLDAAFYLSSALIVLGMAASLLKGFDYEEALLLLVVLGLLWRARPAFDRRASFFDAPFSAGWLAAVAGVVAASVWLGVFAFKHVDYSHELWWQFELHGEASRFLRASVGAAVVVLAAGVGRLLAQTPHDPATPTAAELDQAAAIVTRHTATSANLVFLRDKALLFSDAGDGFVMYGVQGQTWVAMGDPVAPAAACSALIGRFVERCADFGGVPVFYEIGPAHLHRYVDCGLAFVKLGEEARVDLAGFSLDGGRGARFRQALRRLQKDHATFRVVPAAGVAAIVEQLRDVSDAWLKAKAGAEKGFSLGFFDEAYLQRFPVAVIEQEGRIQAFSNLWLGPAGGELSLDLMRYAPAAPKGVMESLLVHLMLWGQAQGYQHFALGMAPLSGVEASPVAPLWNRVGAFMYEHGESVYGFQGLRAYKEKFDPEWEPRYLAYPGGLRLPRVLADTSALIAGGYRRIFLK